MPLIQANGIELFYDLSGPADAPVIAFSNSVGATLEMWDAQVRALSNRYRCLRYDTRGHGRSQVRDHPASIADLADDLAGLLDALHIETAHVAGLSLGGMTAQVFALRHASRLGHLVLMATSARMAGGYGERAALVRANGMAPIVDAVMQRWFTPAFFASAPETVSAFRQRFVDLDPRGYAVCCEAIGGMDLREDIAAIKAPTLVIAGIDDPATPVAMLEDIRGRIRGSELIVLPQVSHILAVEQAAMVNRHLAAFLDSAQPLPQAKTGGASFDSGLANRKAVLGIDHVQRSLDKAGRFAMPWQDFITRVAWGEIWGDPTLPWKTRSLITLAMMVALHREEEFKLHLRPALKNGVGIDELRALLMQTAVYGGVPAANAAFRWATEVLGDELA